MAVLNDCQHEFLPMFDFGIDLIQNVCKVNLTVTMEATGICLRLFPVAVSRYNELS